ncbi:hypothetical protein [Bacillus sonorensis]|uniref:hypothetical protein n=1 Tax=Bacillus sonorensis TaxID=119858 RepID=UPI0012DDC133|nr:hypothetical protein [Bacillus sonorensis]MEC1591464.1 hypothetical protein [Bacillus sonorensis]
MKKKINEYQIYEEYREQIYKQVENDSYAKSLGIELTKFEAGLQKLSLKCKAIW